VFHGEGYDFGKSVTSSIKIVRELTEEEIRELLKGQVDYEVCRDDVTKELHRDNDLPAKISYYWNGNVKYEEWLVNGVNQRLNRENDLPASIWYYPNGSVQIERWYNNGKGHRDNDLPVEIYYYKNKSVKRERWYVNGKLHRENDLPAFIKYNENGSKKYEQWFINGLLHRNNDHLPTFIEYVSNNTVDDNIIDNNGVIVNIEKEE
jgi:hypothetical protein